MALPLPVLLAVDAVRDTDDVLSLSVVSDEPEPEEEPEDEPDDPDPEEEDDDLWWCLWCFRCFLEDFEQLRLGCECIDRRTEGA